MRAIVHRPPAVSRTTIRTFGEARAERYLQRFAALVKQNQTLIAAKNVTDDPVQTAMVQKQELVVGEMDRLHQKQQDEQKDEEES